MVKNVLIVGLGGVGAVYASKIDNVKILVNNERFLRYKNTPMVINNRRYDFEYITPNQSCAMDLIIIATKFYDLDMVLDEIKNFVNKNTIILSLMNGITSEDIIKSRYPQTNVVKSYLICNSIIREGRNVFHDNVNKIVLEHNENLKKFLDTKNINYEISDDIKSAMWQKFMLNIVANQLSAVTKMTFGQMNELPYIEQLVNNILVEVVKIARMENVNNPDLLASNTIKTFRNMAPYGKTSMLQDIESGKTTEVDAFAGTIIQLGKKHQIKTPYNDIFKYLL